MDSTCDCEHESRCRAQLQKEKQAREDAERQRRELEDKLKRYENEVESARKGTMRIYNIIKLHRTVDLYYTVRSQKFQCPYAITISSLELMLHYAMAEIFIVSTLVVYRSARFLENEQCTLYRNK